MIDIHTHCLPETDDGANSCGESIAMLQDSLSQGVRICVATPHCVVHKPEDIVDFVERRNQGLLKLKAAIGENSSLYPKIKLGAEVYLDNDIGRYENARQLCIEGTSYMLAELPENVKRSTLSDWLYNLQLRGIKPIIAHIDRYKNWSEVINEAGATDVLYQVNASRFLTFGGRSFVRKFLKYRKSFVVASDMHNTTSRRCNMKKAYKAAYSKYGSLADELFENKAREILQTR